MLITLLFFDSLFHLTQLWPNGFICGGEYGAYPWFLFYVSERVGLSARGGRDYTRRNTVLFPIQYLELIQIFYFFS